MTIDAVTKACDVSGRTVRRAIQAGHLPSRRVLCNRSPVGWRHKLTEAEVQVWGITKGWQKRTETLTMTASATEQNNGSGANDATVLRRENELLQTELSWIREQMMRLQGTMGALVKALPAFEGKGQLPADTVAGAAEPRGEAEKEALEHRVEELESQVRWERQCRRRFPLSWSWRERKRGGQTGG